MPKEMQSHKICSEGSINSPPIGATGIPLPAALATPGPPGASLSPSSGGGGPSIVILTTESPLNTINPKLRFSSFSSVMP